MIYESVLEKAGYARIGTRHEYVYGDGKWHDSYLFELLRRDWESKQCPIL